MRSEPTEEPDECVGVRETCWDAKRRVWQAIDLVRREQQRGPVRPVAVVPRRMARESGAETRAGESWMFSSAMPNVCVVSA